MQTNLLLIIIAMQKILGLYINTIYEYLFILISNWRNNVLMHFLTKDSASIFDFL